MRRTEQRIKNAALICCDTNFNNTKTKYKACFAKNRAGVFIKNKNSLYIVSVYLCFKIYYNIDLGFVKGKTSRID